MILGCARVSTDAQDLGNQLAALKAAGCEKILRDKLTGAHAEPADPLARPHHVEHAA